MSDSTLSSPPLVLLHGWAMTPAVWQPLQDTLASGRPSMTLPLSGHDGSPAPDGAALNIWTDNLLSLIPQHAILCGWSLGGLLALALAQRLPQQIDRLILIGTTPCFVSRTDWPHGLPPETVNDFNHHYTVTPETTLRRFLALQVLGDTRRKTVQNLLSETQDPAALTHSVTFAQGLQLLSQTDARSLCASVRQPVLLLHGRHDALMPSEAAEWMAETLPDARLHILDGCGHAPFLSRPAECARLIGEFCGH